MAEVFNSNELEAMRSIEHTSNSLANYRRYVKEEEDKIKALQSQINGCTTNRNTYLIKAEEYEADLARLRERLRGYLKPPTSLPVLLIGKESIAEDCVDQLEARSKSEIQNAVSV